MNDTDADRYLQYIAGNLAKLRAKRGLTQEALAEKLELEPSYVQKLERSRATPSLPLLIQLAAFFDVPPQAFFKRAALPRTKVGRPRKR